ncbi:MAG TPA: PAS domain-containing protein, partial [Nitrospirales bacterium]|nr:PAS domain-containing protein [Nitrospirales bacterium]
RPVELRSLMELAYSDRRPVQMHGAARQLMDRTQQFDVEVTPLLETGGSILGASITFTDVSGAHGLQVELQRSKHELETAYEELQSTNEELETTNEELQSTVEELETTNEELQSTNEELETMNEELQSTNEELQTVNTELRERTDDLNKANVFQQSILTGLQSGVAVMDRELRVLIWNHRMEDLWGLREAEVKGHTFAGLDMGLPVSTLLTPMQTCLVQNGNQVMTVPALTRRGKTVNCRVVCSPLGQDGKPQGVILVVEEVS